MTDGKTRMRRVSLLQVFLLLVLGAFAAATATHAQESPAAPQAENATEAEASPDNASGGAGDDILLDDEGLAEAGVTEAEMMLPADLSPWGMFMQADIVVKAVMIGLIFASIVTWTIWFAKWTEINGARRRAKQAFTALAGAKSLDEAGANLGKIKGPVAQLAEAAITEVHVSGEATDKEGVKERIAWRFQRIEANAARDIGIGTGVLATIGATAPFVGLFGTVWGIMNSFIGISEAQTTNLAIVAPGIAEALLATAFGLVAAIPAVIFYNQLARSIGGYKAIVGDGAAAVARLASRELDKAGRVELRAAAE